MFPALRVIVLSSISLLPTFPLFGQLLIEPFDYSPGQLTDLNGATSVSKGRWVSLSGTGNPILVTQGSLLYPGYPSSGGGNKIQIKSTSASAEDAWIAFTPQTRGTTFGSFLISVLDTLGLRPASDSVGDYFLAFLSSTSSTNFVGRVAIRRGLRSGSFHLGIRTSTQNPRVEWSNLNLSIDSTHLVIVSYSLVPGSKNDTTSLWVNPDLQAGMPRPIALQAGASSSEPSDLGRLVVRQDGTDTPDAYLDGFRVGICWEDAPLPIQLASFEANRAGSHVIHLHWTTQSEINNYGFEVQRSIVDSCFATLPHGFVAGGGTTIIPRTYDFSDSSAPNVECSYRLLQRDLDGSIHLSPVVRVFPLPTSVSEQVGDTCMLSPNYPNPFNSISNFGFRVLEFSWVTLKIYDLLGREVAVLVNETLRPGHYVRQLDASGLSSGVYLVRISAWPSGIPVPRSGDRGEWNDLSGAPERSSGTLVAVRRILVLK